MLDVIFTCTRSFSPHMRRPTPKTIFDDLEPLTDKERREFYELALKEYPKRVVDRLAPAQRTRFRELLRRQRPPIDEAMVRKIAAKERKRQKHGYQKRTGALFGITARRVAQIIEKD